MNRLRSSLADLARLTLLAALILVLPACAKVPGTGRSQLSLVSDSELNTMATSQYQEIIQKGPLSANQKDTELIQRVGAKIRQAAETYLRENGRSQEIATYRW